MPNRRAQPDRTRGRGRFARAFTVVELLVVVVIILIVLTIATPAFQALIYSSSRSRAFNTVNAAALAARELALRSASGDDAAVVFVYDASGSMRIIPAVRVGSVFEPVWGGGGSGPGGATGLVTGPLVERDVFAPVPQAPAFEMPGFWSVRGFAPARSMIEFVPGERPRENVAVWYNSPLYGGTSITDDAKREGNWVFPETAFYDRSSRASNTGPNQPTTRQSFMIRYDARTGGLSAETRPALFVDPRPSSEDRLGGDRPSGDQLWLRADRADDLAGWARGLINSGPINPDGSPVRPPFEPSDDSVRLSYIGMASNDTVLVKPVSRIAVYDERRMGSDIGARRLNADTNSLYRPYRSADGGEIALDAELFGGSIPGEVRERINAWIEGDTNFDERFDEDDGPQARIYLVRPGTGELTEVLR